MPLIGPLTGVYVMVVDDNDDARDILKTVLARHGALVVTAPSSTAALRLFLNVGPDVLVSDLAMAQRSGLWLIRAIRRLPDSRYARVPAIAITAYRESQQRARALGAGFDEYVEKPIDMDRFVQLVGALVHRNRAALG